MRKFLKIEFCRAFTCPLFYIALLFGLGIAIWQFIDNAIPMAANLPLLSGGRSVRDFPGLLYAEWIGNDSVGPQQFLYYLLFPFISVLPFGASFLQDKKMVL